MKNLFIVLITLLFVSAGCLQQSNDIICESDSDCVRAGCSGEICAQKEKAENIVTPCVFKEEYECLELTECSCNDNGCEWEENPEYLSCLEEKRQ